MPEIKKKPNLSLQQDFKYSQKKLSNSSLQVKNNYF